MARRWWRAGAWWSADWRVVAVPPALEDRGPVLDATAGLFFAFILVLGTLAAFYLFNKALRLVGA